MLVAEGPGFMEDLVGIPMVGAMDFRGSRCNRCKNTPQCFGHRILSKPKSFGGKRRAVTCKPEPVEQLTYTDADKFWIRSAGSLLDAILIEGWGFRHPRQNWIDYYNSTAEEPIQYSSPFFLTNIVACRPWEPSTLRDMPPPGVAKESCRQWLIYQWAAVNPKIIIAMGVPALQLFLGSEEKANAAIPGEIIMTKFGAVIPCVHLAHTMREPNQRVQALGLAKIKETIRKALVYAGLEPALPGDLVFESENRNPTDE